MTDTCKNDRRRRMKAWKWHTGALRMRWEWWLSINYKCWLVCLHSNTQTLTLLHRSRRSNIINATDESIFRAPRIDSRRYTQRESLSMSTVRNYHQNCLLAWGIHVDRHFVQLLVPRWITILWRVAGLKTGMWLFTDN